MNKESVIKKWETVLSGDPLDAPWDLINETLAILKQQETIDTGEKRIFECKKCGYGIDDIYLSDECNFNICPHFCPNCGRLVKQK